MVRNGVSATTQGHHTKGAFLEGHAEWMTRGMDRVGLAHAGQYIIPVGLHTRECVQMLAE